MPVVRLYDSPEFIRRHVFDAEADDNAKIAFYLSASSFFTLSVTDIRGESYTLEAKAGHDGIPIDDFIVLFCEVGVSKTSTVLRILVNDKEVARREVLVPINLGKMNWKHMGIGGLRTENAPAPPTNEPSAPFRGVAPFSNERLTYRHVWMCDSQSPKSRRNANGPRFFAGDYLKIAISAPIKSE